MVTLIKRWWGTCGGSDHQNKTSTSRISRTEIALLALVMVFGAGLRLHGVAENGMWNDEVFTLIYSSGSSSGRWEEHDHSAGFMDNHTRLDIKVFKEFITKPVSIQPIRIIQDTFRYEPDHPPLYYMVVNVALAALGVSEFAARLPSVIFGVLTIPFVFLIGHRLHSTVVGLIAAGIYATAPYQVYYGQDARMYAMVSFFSVASTWLLLEISLGSTNERRTSGGVLWPAYTASVIAGTYTHWFFVFVLGTHLVFIVLMHRHDRLFLRRWLTAAGLSVLLVSLWFGARLLIDRFPVLEDPRETLQGHGSVVDVVKAASDSVLELIWTPKLRPYHFKWIWIILIALGFLKSMNPGRLRLIPIWVLLSSVGIIMVDMLLDTHVSSVGRYFAVTAPALYLLLAMGIAAVRPRPVAYLLTIVVLGHLVMGGYLTGEGRLYYRYEYKRIAQEIDKVGPDQRIVVISEDAPDAAIFLAYYLAGRTDGPGTIDIINATEPDPLKVAELLASVRDRSHLTVAIHKWNKKALTELTEQIEKRSPDDLKLEGPKHYHGLDVLWFDRLGRLEDVRPGVPPGTVERKRERSRLQGFGGAVV